MSATRKDAEPNVPEPRLASTEEDQTYEHEPDLGRIPGSHRDMGSTEHSDGQAARLKKAYRYIQRLEILRKDAMLALMATREKMRDHSYKRDQVSMSFANFMRELQTLEAKGMLVGFDNLLALYQDIHSTRDLMGPAEKESIDAEGIWEGKILRLEREEHIAYNTLHAGATAGSGAQLDIAETVSECQRSESEYDSFQMDDDDFVEQEDAASSQSDSDISAPIISSLTPSRNESVMMPSDGFDSSPVPIPVDLDAQADDDILDASSKALESGQYYSSSEDSITIDRQLDLQPYGYSIPNHRPKSLRNSRTDLSTDRLFDFTTIREWVNKWLIYNLLHSKVEAMNLKDHLDMVFEIMPSNWAQLVFAWWDRDMAANPQDWKQPVNNGEPLVLAPTTPANTLSRVASAVPYIDPWPNTVDNPSTITSPSTHRVSATASEHATSQTSYKVTSYEVRWGACQHFVNMLCKQAQLKELFQSGQTDRNRQTFRKMLKRLLGRFPLDLFPEAKLRPEVEVVTFFADSLVKITEAIEAVLHGLDSKLDVGRTSQDSKERINQYMQSLEPGFEEGPEDNEEPPELLERLRGFIVGSHAFCTFCDALSRLNSDKGMPNSEILSESVSVPASSDILKPFEGPREAGLSTEDDPLLFEDVTPRPTPPLSQIGQSGEANKAVSYLSEWPSLGINIVQEPDQDESIFKNTVKIPETSLKTEYRGEKKERKLHDSNLPEQLIQRASTEPKMPTRTWTQVASYPKPWSGWSRDSDNRYHQRREVSHGEIETNHDLSKRWRNTSAQQNDTSPLKTTPQKSSVPSDIRQPPASLKIQSANVDPPSGSRPRTASSSESLRSSSNYKVHPRSEFSDGKVFKIARPDAKSRNVRTPIFISNNSPQNNPSHENVRRFVIVEIGKDNCYCWSIATYGGQGTARADVNAYEHAIIYSTTPKLRPGEQPPSNPPIRVIPSGPAPQRPLHGASRLNYAKLYEVNYTEKVWFIGHVDQSSQKSLRLAYSIFHPTMRSQDPQKLTTNKASPVTYAQAASGHSAGPYAVQPPPITPPPSRTDSTEPYPSPFTELRGAPSWHTPRSTTPYADPYGWSSVKESRFRRSKTILQHQKAVNENCSIRSETAPAFAPRTASKPT